MFARRFWPSNSIGPGPFPLARPAGGGGGARFIPKGAGFESLRSAPKGTWAVVD